MSAKRNAFLSMLILAAAVVFSAEGVAQVSGSAIQGTVRDEQGGVVPGVTITMRNVGTGITRTVTTNGQGRYQAPNLDLGGYEVRAELSGFQTAVRTGITLTLGAVAVVDLTLNVGAVTEQVTVTGEAPVVETTQSSVAALVTGEQITELPLNLRSYTELATLQEGVVRFRVVSSGANGGGVQISFAGSRPDTNAYMMDGTDINSPVNKAPASAAGGAIGVESIREFNVLTNTYSAQYGKSMGGQLNAVTKSGTNELHGSVYEFLRNDRLDAKNFFLIGKPAFKRNQYGASLGGPILRDKLFFFGNYEGFRERQRETYRSAVPDENARLGILPGIAKINVPASVQKYLNNLNLFPLPSPEGANLGNGRKEFVVNKTAPVNDDFFLVRGDHYLSEADSFFVRYAHDDGIREPAAPRGFGGNDESPYRFATIQETHIFSPTWLNTFRFSFNRSANLGTDPKLVDIPRDLWFTDNAPAMFPDEQPFGNIDISGGLGIGANRFGPLLMTLNNIQVGDDINYSSGAHSLKFGLTFKRMQYNVKGALEMRGRYVFTSLANFLRGSAREFRAMLPGADGVRGIRHNLVGMYIQDDYQARPGLTLNLGLRYEFITIPYEVNGKTVNLRDLMDPAATIADPAVLERLQKEQYPGVVVMGNRITAGKPYYDNYSLRNFAPRIGFAWDVFGAGKTSVKGGYGIYYDHILSNAYNVAVLRNSPFMVVAIANNPRFPDQYKDILSSPSPEIQWHSVQGHPSPPYMQQWNLSIEQELLAGTSVRLGYVGSHGLNLGRLIDNVAFSVDTPEGRFVPVANRGKRRNPNWSEVRQRTFDSSSFYQGLLTRLTKRYSQGFMMQVSYTFSKSIDDASNFIGQGEAGASNSQWTLVPDDHTFDRGLSNFDVRHNFVFNSLYELPFGPGKPFGGGWTGLAEKLLGGWAINGILSLKKGSPDTIETGFDATKDGRGGNNQGQRPDLVAGKSNNPVLSGGRDPNKYYDPTAFAVPREGFYGNLGRSTLIGPGEYNVDFSLVKNANVASISESFNVQFRAEFFNLFNRANFGEPNRIIHDSTGQILGDAGRITSTRGENRQIQLGLKVVW